MIELDKQVAEALGWHLHCPTGAMFWLDADGHNVGYYVDLIPEWDVMGWPIFSPSTNWAQGGLLIEEYGLDLSRGDDLSHGENYSDEVKWRAVYSDIKDDAWRETMEYGPTPLIAAMKALVASKEEE
jgi:hypothetical protein